MNILTEPLPDHLEIDGKKYPIHTNFKNWIRFEILMSDKQLKGTDKLVQALLLCYKALPPNIERAIYGMLEFYRGANIAYAEKVSKNQTCTKPIYSFLHDSEYIYSAFYEQYGIDLACANLHWWQFKALFRSLENNRFTKIMGYRSISLADIKGKEERKFYRHMKGLYRLPDNRTEDEKEQYMIEVISGLP